MTAQPDAAGFLMRESWRADVVLARKIELPGGRYAPGTARTTLGEMLAERLDETDLFDASVLVSELVTNAVRHGRADEDETIVVHVAIAPDVLRVEVCDHGPGFEPPAVPRPRRHGGGNGLVLLARMSSTWGVAGDDGTCVWFERALAPARLRRVAHGARYRSLMTTIASSTLANGLPLHLVALDGARSVTILVAFDAGARTERPEENGMAHFLEHLVFKGGEKYPHYRDVNDTAERLGGALNAYTSHDLVAFHLTVRAEAAMEATDLLTDFVGRPHIDAGELDRERGVVIQEIQRYKDEPSSIAEELIDRAAFGEHPLGRPVLGPEEHLRTFTRDAIVAFRDRRWSGARGGAFIVGNIDHVAANGAAAELFERFPTLPEPEPYEPAPAFAPEVIVEERDTNQSHLRMSYRPRLDVTNPAQRAAMTIYATLLGGSMSSRLFDEIREQRGLAYSVYGASHSHADVPLLQLGAGLDSTKCVEAYRRMREIVNELREDGPTVAEVERARAYTAGRRVLAFESTNAVARHAAMQSINFGEPIDPDGAIAALDAVTLDQVVTVASDVADTLAIACVGPHSASDFD